jgi:Tfp pilus assembly protein PilO
MSSMSDRDRKLLLIIVPIVVFGAYWMLLLSPKRQDATKAAENLTVQEQRRDAARQRVDQLTSARGDFAADYAQLVRLGKAVPEHVDMPTLLVQLQAAADGTGVSFTSIATEAREEAAVAPAAPPPAAPGSGDGSQPAAAGGAPAQSAPGGTAEAAGSAVTGANVANEAAAASGVDPADTQTSETAREGGLPVGGGAAGAPAAPAPGTSGVPGLDTVPITLRFDGDFFGLADFFHRLKRYVEVSDRRVLVRGRLITIDGIAFTSEPDTFPKLSAEITATAYLAPKTEGATAGASPTGPAVTATAPSQPVSSPTPAPPTATATP